MQMPTDGAMLLSLVNMKLRDGCQSPAELCAEQGWEEEELHRRLAEQGYGYDEGRNCFIYMG